MTHTIRPLQWPGARTPEAARQRGSFKAGWTSTLQLLDRELEQLAGRNVVMQVDVTEAEIRLDGQVRATARPASPAVRILFDSRHGPMAYGTDLHHDWRDNVRAIALSLEALRKVDRYGVTKGAEQYKGWLAIEAGTTCRTNREEAALFIAEHGADLGTAIHRTADHILIDVAYGRTMARRAAKNLHPDQGGSPELFLQLQEAKAVLGL